MTTTTTSPTLRSVVDVHPLHLSVSETHDTGEQRNLFYKADEDLSVKLAKGGEDIGEHAQGGLVLISLSVDGEHDEVSVECGHVVMPARTTIAYAREALTLVEKALQRVTSTTSGPDA